MHTAGESHPKNLLWEMPAHIMPAINAQDNETPCSAYCPHGLLKDPSSAQEQAVTRAQLSGLVLCPLATTTHSLPLARGTYPPLPLRQRASEMFCVLLTVPVIAAWPL